MLFQETFFFSTVVLGYLIGSYHWTSTLCIWFLLVFQLPCFWLDIMFSLPVDRKTHSGALSSHCSWLPEGGCFKWIITVVLCLNQGQKRDNGYIASRAFPAFVSLQESVTSEWDLHHDYTTSQLGLHELLREWRAEMDIFSREPGRYRYGSHNSTTMPSCKKLGLVVLLSICFAAKYNVQ